MSASLTILDVGHGNAAVVEGPDGVLVIDAGPGGGDLLQYLSDQEISLVDCIVISHADNDHLRGLLALLESSSVEIGEVRLNPDAAKLSDLWESVAWSLSKLDKEGKVLLLTACADGDLLPAVDPSVEALALGPDKELVLHGPGWTDGSGRTATSNSCSVVVRLSVNGEAVALLPSDIDAMGLDYLLSGHNDIGAPLLVFPHHGGNVTSRGSAAANREFATRIIESVQPKSVVFSIGRARNNTPRPEIVAVVRSLCADVRIACTQLSERCRVDEPAAGPGTHLLDIHANGRKKGFCCAGSLRLDLGGELTPSGQDYEEFKLAEAPSALCG